MEDDFKVTIAPDEETAFWTRVQDKCKNDIKEMRRNVIINEAIIDCAKKQINKEEEKDGE